MKVRRRPLLACSLVALTIGASPVVPSSAAPGVYTYPGSAPCNGSLQKCIDGVPSGATIRLKDTAPIDVGNGISIYESVTLEAAPGARPIVRGPAADYPGTVGVEEPGTDPDTEIVTIRNITFKHLYVSVRFYAGSGHRFSLTGSTISHNVAHNNTNGVNLQGDVPSTFIVRNNRIQTTGTGITYHGSNNSTARFENNRIFGASLDGEVAGGISANFSGGRSSIRNNVIHDVTGCNCGGADGVSANLSGGAIADIVNNTIDKAPFGTGIGVQTTSSTANVFNNTVTRADVGLVFQTTGSPTVAHGYNNSFNNDFPDEFGASGPGTNGMSVSPRFVDLGERNFRLKKSSNLINAGQTCNPGGGTSPDVGGRDRVWTSRIDVGAYEYSAPRYGGGLYVTGSDEAEVLRGTNARDVICGKAGADDIDGKGGKDLIDPGLGKDWAWGGGGNDAFYSRDDQKDTGNGGAGNDDCYADQLDSFSSCTMHVATP